MYFRPFIFSALLLAGLTSFDLFAQSAPAKKRSSRNAQVAIVVVEGAAVYKYPNFDAPVVDYLRQGTKVLASIKSRPGIGGFGVFYKVKLKNNKYGWMTDVDLLPKYKDDPRTKQTETVNPEFEQLKEKAKYSDREPVFFERYMGGTVGLLGFAEKFSGRTLSEDVLMYGFRMVGPGTLFDGPPMDFNLLFSPQAPGYYDEFSSSPATGFFLFSDMLFQFPVFEGDNGLFILGVGLMATYTKFNVHVSDSFLDSQEFRIGLATELSYMHRIGKYALRLDAKYYYEKTDYVGYFASFLFFYK